LDYSRVGWIAFDFHASQLHLAQDPFPPRVVIGKVKVTSTTRVRKLAKTNLSKRPHLLAMQSLPVPHLLQ
jgi:hypothetical protein